MKQMMIQMSIVAMVAFITGCSTLPCCKSSGYTQWKKSDGGNGHYYKAILATNVITWTEAEGLARADGGYLATITSCEENAFVFGLINDPKYFIGKWGSGPALGGYQLDGSRENDGGWCWVNGEPWNFNNWAKAGGPFHASEPDNYRGIEDRLCFASGIAKKPAATWNDLSRNDKELPGYVIERDN